MPVAKRLTIDSVDLDDRREMDAFDEQVITAGMERVRSEGDKLRRRGVLDDRGKLLAEELPPDMREGADRDFGG